MPRTRLIAVWTAALTLLMLAGIIVSLVIGSWEALQKFGFAFLWRQDWNPPMDDFGALIPIYGTIVTSLIALVMLLDAGRLRRALAWLVYHLGPLLPR